jgi:hypothetical protein
MNAINCNCEHNKPILEKMGKGCCKDRKPEAKPGPALQVIEQDTSSAG